MAVISNGTTIADAGAFSVNLGSMVHIKTLTASNSGDLSFVHGSSNVVLDSTYPIYLFKFINMHPATDNVQFMHNGSIDAGSNYNVAKTNTLFEGEKAEGSDAGTCNYVGSHDIAQGTGNAKLTYNCGNDNDQSLSGVLHLFDPSSTTFVKHFMYVGNASKSNNQSINFYIAGYGNTTSAVNAIQFKADSGNIDSGTIDMYGVL